MTICHRLARLERIIAPLPSDRRRCSICKDGTLATGSVSFFDGVQHDPTPPPCPGCGHDAPTVFRFFTGVPPPKPAGSADP